MDYQVKLPVFEGPLDLLLHLIEKRELDITAISLSQVTDQYLEHLGHAEDLNPDSLADFVVVAAKLLAIKSFALLPSRAPTEEEEEIANDLATALIEYQLFKRAAEGLRDMEETGRRTFSRRAKPVLPPPPATFGAMAPDDLLRALLRMLAATAEIEKPAPLPRRVYTVAEKIDVIQLALAEGSRVTFSSLLTCTASRLEIIVTLLALLELIRKGEVEVEQAERFGEIHLLRTDKVAEG